MKKALSLILTMCMIFALATAISPAASADDQIVIKFGRTPGDLEPTASREVMYATTFKEYVESHSDTIKVELYPSDTLGSANDVVGAIAAGTVEMGAYDFSLINNYYPETMVFCRT